MDTDINISDELCLYRVRVSNVLAKNTFITHIHSNKNISKSKNLLCG